MFIDAAAALLPPFFALAIARRAAVCYNDRHTAPSYRSLQYPGGYMRITTMLMIIALMFSSGAAASEKKVDSTKDPGKKALVKQPKPLPSAPVIQGEFAHELISVFGWEGGIPKEPKDRDYLLILQGKRTFKFEAENIFNAKTDGVSVRNFELVGPFSGESWLGGVSTPVSVHFKVFIPLDGEYQLAAAAKGNGQIWKVAGKEYTVNSGERLTVTPVATVPLKAGEFEFEMVMPPNGGIDYLVFSAPDFTSIEPLGGWRFKEPLTNTELAEVSASLLGWEERLPLNKEIGVTTIIAADLPGLPPSVKSTDAGYHGKFTGKKWIRAKLQAADIEIPISLPVNGVYGLKLRVMGVPFKANLDGMSLIRPVKPYLDWVDLGLHRLVEGTHTLLVTLPSYGGIDALVIEPRKSTPEAYMNLVGVKGDPMAVVTNAEKDKILSQLVERFTARK